MKRGLTLLAVMVALTACAVAAPASVMVDEPATAELVCYTVTPTPCMVCPTCPAAGPTPTGTPAATATPVVPDKPACWDPYLDTLGVTVERRNGEWELVAAWTTTNGQWDPVIACAKAWQTDQLGGDHSFFARTQIDNALPMPNQTIALVWPSGGDTRTTDATGWKNLPMAGQGWNPANGPGGDR